MSGEQKKKYIRYTPEQLAAVPTPSEREAAPLNSTVKAAGVGAVIGAVTGSLFGVSPTKGAAIGGVTGAVGESAKSKDR